MAPIWYPTVGVDDFVRRVTWVSARTPTEEEAQLLRQDSIDPVMISRKIDVDNDGLPVEFNETVWSARRAQLCLPVSKFARAEDGDIHSFSLPDGGSMCNLDEHTGGTRWQNWS